LFGEVALMASNAARLIREIGASVAPAMTTSAVPFSMSAAPCPTESIPAVHPVEISAVGPSAATSQATSTASVLGSMYP
jgi:hypothetical protein